LVFVAECEELAVFVIVEELDKLFKLDFVFEFDGDNDILNVGVFDDVLELLILGDNDTELELDSDTVVELVIDEDEDSDILDVLVFDCALVFVLVLEGVDDDVIVLEILCDGVLLNDGE